MLMPSRLEAGRSPAWKPDLRVDGRSQQRHCTQGGGGGGPAHVNVGVRGTYLAQGPTTALGRLSAKVDPASVLGRFSAKVEPEPA